MHRRFFKKYKTQTKVLLFGPLVGDRKGAYGGGTGGYTRNMSAYLTGFQSENFLFIPCFHSIRRERFSIWNSFLFRFLRDSYVLAIAIVVKRPTIVHIMAQYRSATPRELMTCWISRFFGKKVFYEIKAGLFEKSYNEGSATYRWMIRQIIKGSHQVGVEGICYQDFLQSEFHRESVYLPNFCLNQEIPVSTKRRFLSPQLRVIFVGYCYQGKGTFELVEGCIEAAKAGIESEYAKVFSASPSEVPKWLYAADFGLALRHQNIINHVASPIKLGEYLLSGLKVIVSNDVGDTSADVATHNLGVHVNEEQLQRMIHDGIGNEFDRSVPTVADRNRIRGYALRHFDRRSYLDDYIAMYS